ncbi:neurogenic locus notch homolog protein 4-like [Haliotis rubra]|uniref:neurogenic locus notch homolog protein 4-like n=1 Tax=Haliotis rubra TaxID=36100 RepID=UPI001EE59CBE|nr:neurogenic locus notch homolog protein 4-like [Haliotis rubra]
MHDIGHYDNIMVYMGMGHSRVDKKAKNMQLFRVPISLPLLVLSCWAVLDGVYGCTVPDDCHHSGKCITATKTCNCIGTGYTGETCDDETNECKTSHAPCDEHADCTNTPGSYNCTCKPGYAGDGNTCTEGVCSKDGKECLNGGKCETSKTPTTCTCASGYKGANLSKCWRYGDNFSIPALSDCCHVFRHPVNDHSTLTDTPSLKLRSAMFTANQSKKTKFSPGYL